MPAKRLFGIISIIFLFVTCTSCKSSTDLSEEKRILVIQSYEKHFPAYEKMKEIMSSDLRKKGIHASVYSFYLDCEQYSEKQQRQKLFKKLNELSTWNPDIILVNDDQALNALISSRHPLAKSIPVVFMGFLPVAVKQQLAMIAGGICGVLTLIGGSMLLIRRLFNQRVRATSTTPDIIIMSILLIQCILGLSTIPFSARYPDGSEMMKLVGWAQGIVTFRGGSSEMLSGVDFIFRVHLVLGMTIFLIFPFTRLVHVWSAPFEYFTRRYQLVRSRR